MDAQKVNILLALHRSHKEELAQRRRSEYLTAILTMLLFGGLGVAFFLLPVTIHRLNGAPIRCIATIGLILIADIVCYAQVKNYLRMCELQRVIAQIDTALGLFSAGEFLPGAPLYPEDWKNSGAQRFWGAPSRVLVVCLFALLAAIALWARGY